MGSMLEVVRMRLEEVGRQGWQEVHEATGVPISTLEKIAYGVHADPRISTVEPLFNFLKKK